MLVVDNYDSFTFNLVHALEALTNVAIVVKRNDEVNPLELSSYSRIVFSPGPGLPQESPALMALIAASMQGDAPVLGVCLGHQALAVNSGARLKNLQKVHHGVSHALTITDTSCALMAGLSAKIEAGRYHSWVVDESGLPEFWQVTCRDGENEIMAMRHAHKPIFGIQFHPESIMTPMGRQLLGNFLAVGVAN